MGNQEQKRSIEVEEMQNKIKEEVWAQLLEKINKKSNIFSRISPGFYHWIGTGAGKSGIAYNFIILNSYAGCEIYLDRGKESRDLNKERFDSLFQRKEAIEKEFGQPFDWERLDEKRASRIAIRFPKMSLNDRDNWESMQEKLVESMIKLESVFRKYVKELD